MSAAISALDSGNPDGEDDSRKASRLAARAARFNKVLPGNRYKELEEMRIKERKAFEAQGLIKVGKTQLGDAVDMRGTCETMCSEYEREFRDFTREVHPFERLVSEGRMDPSKAVAAYSRSDAGAGHGDSAILPSDLRTPGTLVRTLDYLFSVIMTTPPPSTSDPSSSTPRKALGYSAGFIRDRSRAIRKEFAMQSSWGHQEAIESFERIARWHILCLRELQEESGTNMDLHIDSAELNRCFTSLRQHYNDRREELRVETPCPNEAEFTAYMLIYDLNSKSVSIPFSELPSVILDTPIVKIAWEIRRAAQRNFDSQKEGSKHNAELGMNMITRFVKLLKHSNVPFLLASLVEIRLREIRRSALRALRRPYPALKTDAVRLNEMGEVIERKMILVKSLNKILGCEEQESESSAWDDVDYLARTSNQESVDVTKRFGFEVYEDQSGPVGSLINLGSAYDDNRDAPYTRRWKLTTEKRGDASYVDIVNGKAGTSVEGQSIHRPTKPTSTSVFAALRPQPAATAFSFKPSTPATATATAPVSNPPTFFACPPSDHPDVIATKNKALLPGRPPIFAIGSKGIWAEPANYTVDEVNQHFNNAPKIFGSHASADPAPAAAPTPKPSVSAFSFGQNSSVPKPVEVSPAITSKKRRPDEEEQAPPAKAPLFSSSGFFSAPTSSSVPPPTPTAISTVRKAASPTLPPFSIPKPLSPKETSLTASTVSPVRQRKRLASSVLSSSTSRSPPSILRKSQADAAQERNKRLGALPEICARLVDEVIHSMISDHLTSDLTKHVKQQKAAADYQRRRVMRSEAILRWSQDTFEKLVDQEVRRISRAALLEELKRRFLTRRAVRQWRSWAKTQRRYREESEKKRSSMLNHLNSMELSRSTLRMPGPLEPSDTTEISIGSAEIERLDALQIDIEINQAERTKDNFYSPSTFLTAITKHIGPLLSEEASSASTFYPCFHTMISIPSFIYDGQVFGNPPDIDVQLWLNDKFKPPTQLDGDEDIYVNNNVQYNTMILEYGRKVPRWSSIGLYVFQVPLDSDDEQKNTENIAECQDRIGILTKSLERQDTQYIPSLLLLTFDDETIEELGERLQISDEIDRFARKSIICLQYSDDLDERFSKALEIAVPDLIIKDQYVIHLNDILATVHPLWSRFLDISQIQLNTRIGDTELSTFVFQHGVELINLVSTLFTQTLGSIELEDDRKWKPLLLPEFKGEEGDMPFELVERIVEYMQDDLLVGIDDIELIIGPLRQSAQLGYPLPLIPILQSLSHLVLSDLRDLKLETKLFFSDQDELDVKAMNQIYLHNYRTKYEAQVEEYINHLLPKQPPPKSTFTNSSLSPIKTSRSLNTVTADFASSTSASRKRRISANADADENENENENEDKSPTKHRHTNKKGESKAAKNARLLKALRDVENTLAFSEMDHNGLEVI
uniref:SAC3/GANP/THP3 conserved domain-containing protein n=1 Tax=Kwoniella dejecticola CBS 10117 TaxID=1296121 RepID=A0A1A6A0A4_9TREE|nr:uncharacterized protein I303_05773 [Kwoniella dejecticola CBS 10117]OBR83494.1 hypothetical protein I303_05773 [Kwoniella dejecticola CBS 10117]